MDNLLTEDIDVRGEGYALTRVYVTTRHQIVRAEVWRPCVEDDQSSPASALGSVLDRGPRGTNWSPLLELSAASWPAANPPIEFPPARRPEPSAILADLGPIADEVYRRMNIVLGYLSRPVDTVVPVVARVVNAAETGQVLALYGDYDEAHRAVEEVNATAGRAVLSVGATVAYNPPRAVLHGMAGHATPTQ